MARNSDTPELMRARKDFKIGNMSGQRFYECSYAGDRGITHPGLIGIGGGWNTELTPETGVLYAVYSYETPIGWIDNLGRAVIPREHHSHSTSRHQGLVRWGLKDDPKPDGVTQEMRDARTAEEQAIYAAIDEKARLRRNQHDRETRDYKRALKESARIAALTEKAAIDSILNGPAKGPLLLGVDGEKEAIRSIMRASVTREKSPHRARVPRNA